MDRGRLQRPNDPRPFDVLCTIHRLYVLCLHRITKWVVNESCGKIYLHFVRSKPDYREKLGGRETWLSYTLSNTPFLALS